MTQGETVPGIEPGSAGATQVGHWKRDACDVYIGRGSPWGNPYVPRGWGKRSKHDVVEVDDPLGAYELRVRTTPSLMRAIPSLRGRVLGCWCVALGSPSSPERCHGHVLARMADEARAVDAREETWWTIRWCA